MGTFNKTFSLLCLVLSLVIVTPNDSNNYFSIRDLEFANSHSNQLVNFTYTKDEGIICRSNQDIHENKILFNVPKDMLVCSFDYFPFQVEIKEGIQEFINSKVSDQNENLNLVNNYLFAYNLMFLIQNNKTNIAEELRSSKLSSHSIKISNEKAKYIQSLPDINFSYSSYMYEETERTLFKQALGYYKEDYTEDLFNYVLNYIKRKFPQYNNLIHPWISDLTMLKYSLSLIGARAFRLDLSDYERIHNQTFIYMQMGYKRKDKLNDVFSLPGKCFVPIVELCNLRNKNTHDKINYDFIPFQGGIKLTLSKSFNKGEQVYFNDLFSVPNEQLLLSTGNRIDNNPSSISYVTIQMDKSNYTISKDSICSLLKCFDSPMNSFFQNKKVETSKFLVPIYRDKLHERILNFLRLYTLPNEQVEDNEAAIFRQLDSKRIFDVDNEFKALSIYRKEEDILYSLHNTDFSTTPTYEMRRRIMEQGREDKLILLSHLDLVHKKMRESLTDQFRKIRGHFTN